MSPRSVADTSGKDGIAAKVGMLHEADETLLRQIHGHDTPQPCLSLRAVTGVTPVRDK